MIFITGKHCDELAKTGGYVSKRKFAHGAGNLDERGARFRGHRHEYARERISAGTADGPNNASAARLREGRARSRENEKK